MTFRSSYSEKLRDPRWQKKRLEILERDNFTCQHCNATDKTLHVHHWYYIRGVNPWEYDDSGLTTFCEDCHTMAEERLTLLRSWLASGGLGLLDEVIGFCAGATTRYCSPDEDIRVVAASYEMAEGVRRGWDLPERIGGEHACDIILRLVNNEVVSSDHLARLRDSIAVASKASEGQSCTE